MTPWTKLARSNVDKVEPDGRRLNVSIPARQVVIVDPAAGTSRPAEILPPAPVKKAVEKGLMKWMQQSGLLGR